MMVQGVPAVEQEVKSLHPTHWCWEYPAALPPGTRAVKRYSVKRIPSCVYHS